MVGLLLVEGSDDAHVIKHLCDYYGIASDITKGSRNLQPRIINIKAEEGIDKLRQSIPEHLKGAAVERIGIVADADAVISSRWQSLRDRLINATGDPRYTETAFDPAQIPSVPDATGMIAVQNNRAVSTVGVWLMPDNIAAGMLEDFISRLIKPRDPLWSRAVQVVDQIPSADQRFNQATKAYIHTWLAWQEEPGKPMSNAIHPNHYVDAQAPAAQTFVAWLERLFTRR